MNFRASAFRKFIKDSSKTFTKQSETSLLVKFTQELGKTLRLCNQKKDVLHILPPLPVSSNTIPEHQEVSAFCSEQDNVIQYGLLAQQTIGMWSESKEVSCCSSKKKNIEKLIKLCSHGNVCDIERLLRSIPNVNVVVHGQTPLTAACY